MARYTLRSVPLPGTPEGPVQICDVSPHRSAEQARSRSTLEVEVAGTLQHAEVLSFGNPCLVLLGLVPVEVVAHEGTYRVVGTPTVFQEGSGGREQREHGGRGGGVLYAPMPGRVVKVLCQLGNTVEPGTPLVVLEAMKMENELRATRAGTVSAIYVADAQTVEARAKLIEISVTDS